MDLTAVEHAGRNATEPNWTGTIIPSLGNIPSMQRGIYDSPKRILLRDYRRPRVGCTLANLLDGRTTVQYHIRWYNIGLCKQLDSLPAHWSIPEARIKFAPPPVPKKLNVGRNTFGLIRQKRNFIVFLLEIMIFLGKAISEVDVTL